MERKITHSKQLLYDAMNKYGDKLAIFSSFGKDSIVTMHLALSLKPDIKIISVMTPYKFKETKDYKNKITALWELNIKTYEMPELGLKLYETDGVEKCCNYYKVGPSKQAIQDAKLDAWISGLRNTEGHTRKFLEEVEVKDGLVKINPILTWTEAEIWLYHALNEIPVHPLYEKGYRSLGCEPCSSISLDSNEPERAGRWKGTGKCSGECGIHTQSMVTKGELPNVDVYGVAKRDGGKF